MIRIHAKSLVDKPIELNIPSEQQIEISNHNLTVFPGLIDPHVHFRIPGMAHKEDWQHAAKAAIRGGYTTVFDMPNTVPPTITAALLREKMALIDAQLQEVGIPLRYKLYFGADKNHFHEIPKIKNDVIGIKVFMGCSTGNLVIDDDESLHAIFSIAAGEDLLVAVHAEDEQYLKERKQLYQHTNKYSDHSEIRNVEVAVKAVEKAIAIAKIYKTKLYILHVSSAEEIALIKKAKQAGLPVYAETTPHHLFLNDSAYAKLQGKAVVNPALRNESQQAALFAAIENNIIDTIGSDHAPHTIDEKAKAYGECPSGMPGIETTLPLLLNAYHQGLISLEKIIALTVTRPVAIFNLKKNHDIVLVDLQKIQTVNNANLKTKCGWSAFDGLSLRGWPVYTIADGKCFDLSRL